jgi:hypothetical protein
VPKCRSAEVPKCRSAENYTPPCRKGKRIFTRKIIIPNSHPHPPAQQQHNSIAMPCATRLWTGDGNQTRRRLISVTGSELSFPRRIYAKLFRLAQVNEKTRTERGWGF